MTRKNALGAPVITRQEEIALKRLELLEGAVEKEPTRFNSTDRQFIRTARRAERLVPNQRERIRTLWLTLPKAAR